MHELGEFGKAYKEVFEAWVALEEQKAAQPELADTFEDASTQARLTMEMLEENASSDFREVVLDEGDAELERLRANIEAIRETPPYKKGGKISETLEAQIQSRLAELPEPERYSPEDKQLATGFFVGQLVKTVFASARSHEVKSVQLPETPEAAPVSPRLNIKVFTGDRMLLINDIEAIPLSRQLNTTTSTAEEEDLIEEYRLRALQFIADNPGKEFLSRDIWKAIDRTGTEYSSSRWGTFVGDWLQGLEVRGENLVATRKPSPVAKRRYYSQGAFAMDFEMIDGDSGLEQLTIFKLPNGKVITGKTGMVAHLLSRASATNPILRQHLFDKGIYTEEEAEGLRYGDSILSGIVSSVRQNLREAGAQDLFRIIKVETDLKRPGKGKANEPGYYMERVDPAEAQRRKDIHKANVIASYIHLRNGLLEQLGLPTLPDTILEGLRAQDSKVDDEELLAVKDEAYDQLKGLFDDAGLERLLNDVDNADSRFALADWAIVLLSDAEQRDRLEAALRAKVVQVVSEPNGEADSPQVTEIGYEVESAGVITVEHHDFRPEAFGRALIASFDQDEDSAAGASAEQTDAETSGAVTEKSPPDPSQGQPEHLTSAQKKDRRAAELAEAISDRVREAITRLHEGGVDFTSGALISTIGHIFPKLTSESLERHIGKFKSRNAGRVYPADILFGLISEETRITGRHDKRTIKAVVAEELENFQRRQQRRQQAR